MKRDQKEFHRYKVGQVVMLLKSDKIGLPVPCQIQRDDGGAEIVVDYGALGLQIRRHKVRRLTKREAGKL